MFVQYMVKPIVKKNKWRHAGPKLLTSYRDKSGLKAGRFSSETTDHLKHGQLSFLTIDFCLIPFIFMRSLVLLLNLPTYYSVCTVFCTGLAKPFQLTKIEDSTSPPVPFLFGEKGNHVPCYMADKTAAGALFAFIETDLSHLFHSSFFLAHPPHFSADLLSRSLSLSLCVWVCSCFLCFCQAKEKEKNRGRRQKLITTYRHIIHRQSAFPEPHV